MLRPVALLFKHDNGLFDALTAEIARLPRWTLSFDPPGSAAGSPAAGLANEIDWLVMRLVVDEAARAAFDEVLSADQRETLRAAGGALGPMQVQWILDKTGGDYAAQLASRLTQRPAAAADPEPPAPAAPASLTTAASLDQYLAQPTRTAQSTRGLKLARFAAGLYRRDHDALLRERGYHIVIIESPTLAELDELDESEGFWATPLGQRYVSLARNEQDFVDSLLSKQRARMRNRLLKNAAFVPTIAPLDEPSYQAWFEVYAREVLTKPGAIQIYTPSFVADEKAAGTLDQWHGIMFRDGDKALGGVLVNDFIERGLLSIAGAAYDRAYRNQDLALRAFVSSMALAIEHGWRLVSYGTDYNFYGYELTLGLLSHKLSTGVTAFPEGRLELTHVIDHGALATLTAPEGGWFLFTLDKQGEVYRRYRTERAAGREPRIETLLGGNYFTASCARAAQTMIGNHFHPAGAAALPTQEIPIVRRSFDEVASRS